MNIKLKRGFTLLELSISLLLIGIMLSLVGGWFSSSLKTTKTKESAAAIALPVREVINYISLNEEFPVIDNITTSTDIFGNEYEIFNDASFNDDDFTDKSFDVCSLPKTTNFSITIYEDIDDTTKHHTINNIAFVVASKGLNAGARYSINDDNNTLSLYSPNTGTDDTYIYYTIAQLKAEFNCTASEYASDIKFMTDNLLPTNLNASDSVYNRIYFTPIEDIEYEVCYTGVNDFSGNYTEGLLKLMATSTKKVPACNASETTSNNYVYVAKPAITDGNTSTILFTLKVRPAGSNDTAWTSKTFTHQVYRK